MKKNSFIKFGDVYVVQRGMFFWAVYLKETMHIITTGTRKEEAVLEAKTKIKKLGRMEMLRLVGNAKNFRRKDKKVEEFQEEFRNIFGFNIPQDETGGINLKVFQSKLFGIPEDISIRNFIEEEYGQKAVLLVAGLI